MQTITLKELYDKEELPDLFYFTDLQYVSNGFSATVINNEFVSCKLLSYHDEAIDVFYQDWNLLQPFRLRIRHNIPLIKVQFEIEGNSCFESLNNEVINIPSKHYQFIQIPKADGYLTYTSSRKVLDIHIKQQYLFQLLNTQGYSEQHLKEHFLLKNYTFYRKASIISEQQKRLIQDLIQHSYQSDFAREFIRIKAIELILTVFSGASNQLSKVKWSENDVDIMMNLRNFLDQNFHKELHLKTLTRQFGINEFKLKNAFKDLFGETVFSYIRKQRLKKAKDLLIKSDLEIKEIAFLTGFKYSHHFSKVYFNHYKHLPSEHRSQIS